MVSDGLLIFMRIMVAIDEYLFYILILFLWHNEDYVPLTIALVLGPYFVYSGYHYYWKVLEIKTGVKIHK